MNNTIICPKCGTAVEITAALKKQVESEVLAAEKRKHLVDLAEAEKKAFLSAEKRIKEQFELAIKTAKEDAEEEKKRSLALQKQLTEMTQLLRQLRREKEEAEMEAQKKLLREEEKIREETKARVEEEHHLKDEEKDKKLNDALKQMEEMKRKMQQGSQQTQGEVLELELENTLKNSFPGDDIKPVAKGIRGADIIQIVRGADGKVYGSIVWEMKNTKNWTEGWVTKLKDDQRTLKANAAVLVSVVLPSEVKNFSAYKYNDLWVTERRYIVGLATALRLNLRDVFLAKAASVGKSEKMEVLYGYLSSIEFKQRIEAIVEAFTLLQEDIEKEKRLFAAKWARQEKSIRKVIDQTHGMYGDLQSIMGVALPQIKSLQLEDGEEKQKSLLDG